MPDDINKEYIKYRQSSQTNTDIMHVQGTLTYTVVHL